MLVLNWPQTGIDQGHTQAQVDDFLQVTTPTSFFRQGDRLSAQGLLGQAFVDLGQY